MMINEIKRLRLHKIFQNAANVQIAVQNARP